MRVEACVKEIKKKKKEANKDKETERGIGSCLRQRVEL